MIAASSITWHSGCGTGGGLLCLLPGIDNRDVLPIGHGQDVRGRSGSDQVDRNIDVAAGGFGVRARLVRGIHQGLGDVALQTGQADVETSLKEVSVPGLAQIYFGVDNRVSREGNLCFSGRELHRANETGRPAGGEQLLRISTVARSSRRRKLDVQPAIAAAGGAVAAAGGFRQVSRQILSEGTDQP